MKKAEKKVRRELSAMELELDLLEQVNGGVARPQPKNESMTGPSDDAYWVSCQSMFSKIGCFFG